MDRLKVLALYLPQFHETEHNNLWWGEGFTDWTAAKMGEPLFEGHKQPIVPQGSNYYNLLKKETMEKQAKLARKYDIDGFVFYHYYFGKGRYELEKPAENLLKWRDIDMPFCFSWANQSWVRTWSKITGNVWGEKLENIDKDDTDGVLIRQEYGSEEEWKKHFLYLYDFFVDDRYIKIDGKPVFIFWDPVSIPCIKEMISCWNKLAIERGLNGLYYIGNRIYSNEIGFEAIMLNEGGISLKEMHRKGEVENRNGVRCFDYKKYLDTVVKTRPINNVKTYFNVCVGHDSTPRRGKDGECIVNRKPELFGEYFEKLLIKSMYYGSEFLFINAWNEWGEGMHLEPDEEDGENYLEAIRIAKKNVRKYSEEEIKVIGKQIEDGLSNYDEQSFLLAKFQNYTKVYSKWIDSLESKGCVFRDFLEEHKINRIAIYGYYDMGRKLAQRLYKEGFEVSFAIDQTVGSTTEGISVFRPEDNYPEVDCIIVTAFDPDEIREFLIRRGRKEKIYTMIEILNFEF